MQRYNLFQSTHNTLQDVLFDGALSLQQAQAAAKEKETKALQKVTEALMVFQVQARAKEDCILPAMDAYEPSIVDAIKQQHQAAVQLVRTFEATLKAKATLSNLQQAYNQLMVQQLKYMQKGEEIMLPVLWYYYSDTELKKLEARLDKTLNQQIEQAKAIEQL